MKRYLLIALVCLLFIDFLAAQQYFPMPNCSNTQYNGSQCTSTSCLDPRCLTCSSLSVADCILCADPYKLTRMQGQGSCLKVCVNTQIRTTHYNLSIGSVIDSSNDICLAKATNNCTDPNCLSCLENSPDLCLLCSGTLFPRFYQSQNIIKCINCSMAMLNCQECAWSTYCTKCRPTSDTSSGYLIANDGSYCKSCQAAVPYCLFCDGVGKCQMCGVGFYLVDDGARGVCTKCLSYCDDCVNSTSCQTCTNRYFLLDSATCASCNAYINNCIKCDNNTKCNQCEQGFYLTNSSFVCSDCSTILNALSCNGTHVTQCARNTFLDLAQKSCSPCSSIANCNSCDGLSCKNCSFGYYLSSDKRNCISCQIINNCAKCDGVVCAVCQVGYFRVVQNGAYSCQSCNSIQNSSFCDGLTMVKCIDNYLIQNNVCLPCSTFDNCSKCDGTSCVLCQPGYFLYGGDDYISKSCLSCSDPSYGMEKCLSCSAQGICRKCDAGYMLNPNSQCQACHSERNCITCDGYVCTSCLQGYYLTPQMKCSRCDDPNCLSCPFNPLISKGVCQSCQSGYYLHLSSFACIPCRKNVRGQHCVTCEYNLTKNGTYQLFCDSCDDGYGLMIQDKICVQCSLSNCQSCLFDNNTGMHICSKCDVGYYLESNKTCSSCNIPNCLTCARPQQNSPNFQCIVCSSGYFINSSFQCQQCSLTINGCYECGIDATSSTVTCTQCQTPYYYLSNNTCVSCSTATQNCLGCLRNNQQVLCTSCLTTNFLRNPLNCSKCLVSNCSLCSAKDSGKSCIKCLEGSYLLDPGTCELCSDSITNCQICGFVNNTLTCLECSNGTFLTFDSQNKTICSKCSINCQNCTNSSVCLACNGDFYNQITVDGSSCLKKTCDANSNIMDSSRKTCTTCSFLYPNCSSCNSNQCLSCISDHLLMLPTNGFCSLCQESNFVQLQNSKCAYNPKITSIQRIYTVKTGNTFLNLNCGGNQVFRVFLAYFQYLPPVKETVDFSVLNETLSNLPKADSLILFNSSDVFWTVYMSTLTNSNGNLKLQLINLKNSGINYKLQAWCQNFGNADNPLNYLSDDYDITWFQPDNNGIMIKLNVLLSDLMSDATLKSFFNILSNRLLLPSLNRVLETTVFEPEITENGVYEIFYIERDFNVTPVDLSAETIFLILDSSGFKDGLNLDLKNNQIATTVKDISYEKINSTIRNEQPVFKSVDFTRILNYDNQSANFSLQIINTDGFIYLGFANSSQEGQTNWGLLVKGLDPSGAPLNDFRRIYTKAGQTITWNWKGLTPNQGYTIYFGATNEDRFDSATKTKPYRVVFKAKGRVVINELN